MKTKNKSVKRKLSDTDDVQSYTMGPSKELNVRSPSMSTNLHEEGASSNEQKNQTSICDIRMYIQDATEYSSITGNNDISPCALPHSQNTECANLFTKTTNISTENENTNFTTTHLQVNNQNKISPDDLKKAMSRTQVTKAVVGNSDRSNVQVTIDKHNKPSTVTINDNMQTSPLASNNTPASIHTHITNSQQIGNRTHTFETSHHRQPTFTTCSKRTHHDTRSANNVNTTSTRQTVQQQNIRRYNRAGLPVEYIHMGHCTCVCRHCGATFWESEKLANSGFGASAMYNKCCNGGRVVLRAPPEYPMYIKSLYANHHFMENIRAYNQMFSMTSLGANIDTSINNGKGPYVFRISGQIYHWIGSMCPEEGNMPRFLQLYIYDTTNEVKNRMAHFGGEEQSGLKREIVEGLIDFLDNHNALVQLFRTARNKRMEADIPEFKLRLYNVIGTRRYDLPTPETIGAVIFGGKTSTESEFDLIIEEHSQIPQRVNKYHPCYMSLQFPLLFVYGEEGYKKDMKLTSIPGQRSNNEKRMSMNMYYAYQIHDRINRYSLLPRGGKLFQQYVVTAYCAIEQTRLNYILQNQNNIRNEYLSRIYDAIIRGDRDGNDLGTRTILSISFISSPRYMYAHYLDALAICRVHGNPSFFITFTCNAKWPEIQEYMDSWPELTTADRADIVDRVSNKKYATILNLSEQQTFLVI
ncbi:DNA helicase [Tanacetum coccineum]